MTCLLLAAAGCESSSSGKTDGGDHEVEHTKPAHWPSTFTDLVADLKTRFDGDNLADDPELTDLLSWLPEIAGDTSLTEPQWLEAVAAGQSLERVRTGGGDPAEPLATLARLAEVTYDDYPPFVPGRDFDRKAWVDRINPDRAADDTAPIDEAAAENETAAASGDAIPEDDASTKPADPTGKETP